MASSVPAKLVPEDQHRVRQFIEQVLANAKLPGISVAMNVNGETLNVCAGVANIQSKAALTFDARFESGCVTKLLTAILTLELAAQDVLSLNNPISSYLPELCGKNGDRILLRHLLSHTPGYQGENFIDPDVILAYSWEEFCGSFNSKAMLFEPGTVYDYSHSASVILGQVIERVTGRGVLEHIRESIFDPLQMAPIAAETDSPRNYVSGHLFHPAVRRFVPIKPVDWCEFWSSSLLAPALTLGELVLLGEALIGTKSCFNPRIVDSLLHSVVKLPKLFGGMRSEEIPAAFGLGCAHYATGTYGISSSTASQTCALRINPQKKIAVAVGINVCQPFYRDFLINKLMNALLPEDATTRADENAADTFSLEELEGTFQGALHNSLDASIENGQLLLRLGHNPSMSSSARNQPIIFVKNNDGHIVPKNDMQFLTTGFFREPRSGSPCLMIGSSAFKKIQPNDTK